MGPLRDDVFVLTDGRRLGFAEWGDPAGTPVFLFHGAPGSRLLCPSPEVTAARGVRLVVTDRPGYGNSDPKPGRSLPEWPDDVVALADHLGVGRFAVLGWSAGGPHALACAVAIPERLTAAGTIASAGPTDEVPEAMDGERKLVYDGVLEDRLATVDAIVAFMDGVDGNEGKRFYDNVRAEFPDAIAFTDPSWDANFRDHIVEGMRPGGYGRAGDGVAGYGPWGFSPRDVKMHVHLWHGGRDPVVPSQHFAHLASTLPSCAPLLWEDGDHGIIYPHWDEILAALTA